MSTAHARRLLAVAAVAGALFAAVAGAAPAPTWQVIPVGADDRGVVFAAARAWFMNNGTAEGNFKTKSARVAGGRLTGWVTATLPGSASWGVPDLHGQELVFGTPRDGLQAVKLLPNGRFGARRAFVTGAPPPAYSTGSSAIQLRDRVVQLVNACDYVEPPARQCREFEIRLGACCDVNDKAVNYASFVKRGFEPPLLGLDRRGRLWLAWKGPRVEHPGEMVQLDPQTLAPRGTPAATPGPISYLKTVDLACSDGCRLVVQASMRGRRTAESNYTWAPGEPLTPLVLPGSNEAVFGVRPGPRGLEVAFNRSVGPNAQAREVALGRGDARGRGVRVTSSIEIPEFLGSFAQGSLLTIEPRVGAFGPTSFVTTALYEKRGRSTVRATILR